MLFPNGTDPRAAGLRELIKHCVRTRESIDDRTGDGALWNPWIPTDVTRIRLASVCSPRSEASDSAHIILSGREPHRLHTGRDFCAVAAPARIVQRRSDWSLTSAGVGPPAGTPIPILEPKLLQHPEKPKPPIPRPTEGGGL
jgi:hypothetical protein